MLLRVVLVVLACVTASRSQGVRGGRNPLIQPPAPPPTTPQQPDVIVEEITEGMIPLSVMRNSGLLTAMSQGNNAIMRRFMADMQKYHSNMTRSGDSRLRSAFTSMPQMASCMVRSQVIEFENHDPTALLLPACISVDRCSGCCSHPLLQCEPQEKAVLHLNIFMYRLMGNSMVPQIETIPKQVEYHKSCQCGCKLKASACDPAIHNYVDCQCMCKDTVAQKACESSPHDKRWNAATCSCGCARVCGDGFTQDANTCTCTRTAGVSFLFRSYNRAPNPVVEQSAPATNTGTGVTTPTGCSSSTLSCRSTAVLTWDSTSQRCVCRDRVRPRTNGRTRV